MLSSWPARIALAVGIGALALFVVNQTLAAEVTPSLERAGVLGCALSVGFMLVAALWTRAVPEAKARAPLQGDQGLELAQGLPEPINEELGWGSRMLLTATAAATVLVFWDGRILLRRGLLGSGSFSPADICRLARSRQAAISLVDLSLYPGKQEFDALLPGLPSAVVQPLGTRGWIVLGGWSSRCFSRSDLQWLEGWAARLTSALETLPCCADGQELAAPEGADAC
ncbi:MAG: cofactor assembly of complex C subunit B [Cyanobacteriota bacterium]|nr:cofactor assembly of complex C subunit B [Cyanobacteriota bacterium]